MAGDDAFEQTWHLVPGGYEGISDDGEWLVMVPADEMEAERRDCLPSEFPTPDDYLADFNGRNAALIQRRQR